MRPGQLEHQLATVLGAGWGDPGCLTAGLERLAHTQRPTLLQLFDHSGQARQPGPSSFAALEPHRSEEIARHCRRWADSVASLIEASDVDDATTFHGEDLPPLHLRLALERGPTASNTQADEDRPLIEHEHLGNPRSHSRVTPR